MLNQSQLEKYLGRSLKPIEVTNLKTYLSIAQQKLDQLLCMSLCSDGDTKTYDGRIGYKLLYVDPIQSVTSITVDGTTVDAANYTLKQWDNRNAKWFNVIEFKEVMTGDVVVVGDWGFNSLPADLGLLLAKLFAQNPANLNTDARVKSKKIEDFTITYDYPTDASEQADQLASTISKYSLCNLGGIRHGHIRSL